MPQILGALCEAKRQVLEHRPDVLVLVDYPGMNLRMAQFAKSQGIRVVYYILPKVWAWKSGRAWKLRDYCDDLLSILPFETDWFKERGIAINYVGNPLAARLSAVNNFDGNSRTVFLLPGSRSQEIKYLWPVMRAFATRWPTWHFLLVRPVDAQPLGEELPSNMQEVFGFPEEDVKARMALVCSGTATLEMALRGVPQLVLYKAHPVSLFIAKRFVRVSYFSLPNLILNRPAVPELLQEATEPAALDASWERLLNETETHLNSLQELRARLLQHDPATTAAQQIINRL